MIRLDLVANQTAAIAAPGLNIVFSRFDRITGQLWLIYQAKNGECFDDDNVYLAGNKKAAIKVLYRRGMID